MHDPRPIPPRPQTATFDPFDSTPVLAEPRFTYDESLAALDERQAQAKSAITRRDVLDAMRSGGSGRVSVSMGSWSVTHGIGDGR